MIFAPRLCLINPRLGVQILAGVRKRLHGLTFFRNYPIPPSSFPALLKYPRIFVFKFDGSIDVAVFSAVREFEREIQSHVVSLLSITNNIAFLKVLIHQPCLMNKRMGAERIAQVERNRERTVLITRNHLYLNAVLAALLALHPAPSRICIRHQSPVTKICIYLPSVCNAIEIILL